MIARLLVLSMDDCPAHGAFPLTSVIQNICVHFFKKFSYFLEAGEDGPPSIFDTTRRQAERAEAESERQRQDAAVESVLERARRARQQLELELEKEEQLPASSLPVKHKTVR